jgi:hypothetical protein
MIEALLYFFVSFQVLFLLVLWKGRHSECPALTQEELDYARKHQAINVKKDQVFYGQECLQE